MAKRLIKYTVLIIIITCLYCAHKGPPLYVDRIDPAIKKATPINDHQIILYFSEELDTLNNNSENFIIHTMQDTLKIFTANPGNTLDQILLITEKMKPSEYEIDGKVFDKSGRMGIFKTHFLGSTKPDTIAPWLTHYSKGLHFRNFYIEFSEPVDTLSFKYYVFPKRAMLAKWQYLKNVSLVAINESDSFNYDTTYYLYIKEIQDLCGNPAQPFITTITPDTIYNPLFIKGKVMLNDTVVPCGTALIEREKILGISFVNRGEFLFEVRDSLKYLVHVFYQNFYGADSVSTSQIYNIIRLNPGALNLDSLLN